MRIRLKFEKTGALRFIGHLDVMRTFQKINRRAGIDIAYSKGFSPHQEMSFATPLGLGLTSIGEYVDYEMNSVPGKEELIAALNKASTPELFISDACLLPDGVKNAMAILASADYTLSFREGHAPSDMEAFYENLFRYLSRETIPVVKKTKTGTQEVDLRKQILFAERRGNALFLSVDTGSRSNLKPEFVIECFSKDSGIPYDPLLFDIRRDELYGEEDGKRIPLIAYGKDF